MKQVKRMMNHNRALVYGFIPLEWDTVQGKYIPLNRQGEYAIKYACQYCDHQYSNRSIGMMFLHRAYKCKVVK